MRVRVSHATLTSLEQSSLQVQETAVEAGLIAHFRAVHHVPHFDVLRPRRLSSIMSRAFTPPPTMSAEDMLTVADVRRDVWTGGFRGLFIGACSGAVGHIVARR